MGDSGGKECVGASHNEGMTTRKIWAFDYRWAGINIRKLAAVGGKSPFARKMYKNITRFHVAAMMVVELEKKNPIPKQSGSVRI
jgi:hypothetical protein